MKSAVLLTFIIIIVVECRVMNRIILEPTTEILAENDTWENGPKYMADKEYNGESLYDEESRVYLDDVMFALKNEVWMENEKPCLDQIYRLLRNLQNYTLWAVWDWDAQSSEPQGLLLANRYQLGNFDQCMNAPWASTHKELSTQYCLADIILERTDKSARKKVVDVTNPYQSALDFIQYNPPHKRPLNEITWGACVPSSCEAGAVERLLGIMLARSHLGMAGIRANVSITEPCQVNKEKQEFDAAFWAFVALTIILISTALICTYINNRNSDANKTTSKFIKAFCMRENSSDLLGMKKGGLEVFYGIKFLTMCFITMTHQIGISNSGPISDGIVFDQGMHSLLGMLILHDDLFVDTFFLLSGFLAMSYIAKMKKLPNPLIMIFKRYVRLVIAFAIIVFYIIAVFPYTGSGPLWNRVKEAESGSCRKNWWLNVLMVNNYVDSENICLVISWYIPCDFHFFVVTILLYWMYKRSSQLGMICISILTVASIILPGIITYMYQYSAIQLFTIEFITDPRGNRDFHSMYIKSHTRFAAYLVGVFSGYYYVKHSENGNLNRISKKWAITGTLISLLVMLAVMLVGSSYLFRSYHPIEGAVYAALNRPIWACGLTALVFCCVYGRVPLVKQFLSWYPWAPLSRLTYGLYLTHTLIIMRNVFVTRNPQHNDYFGILNTTAGVIFWGNLAALCLWLFAEAPANKILNLCLKSRIKTLTESQQNNETNDHTSAKDIQRPSSSGYLQENLPSTVHYHSKF